MLFVSDYEALEQMDERGGAPAGDIAFCIHGVRSRSHTAIMARTMRGLEAKGLVAKLDDLKPTCWIRTPAGTEASRRKRASDPAPLASAGRI